MLTYCGFYSGKYFHLQDVQQNFTASFLKDLNNCSIDFISKFFLQPALVIMSK